MIEFVIIAVYLLAMFGLAELLVYYDGFLHVFDYIRAIANKIHPHVGELFSCVVCCSCWLGIVMSLINSFIISHPFTPFNIALGGYAPWWIIMILDMSVTCGSVILLHHLDEALENLGITYNDKDNE